MAAPIPKTQLAIRTACDYTGCRQGPITSLFSQLASGTESRESPAPLAPKSHLDTWILGLRYNGTQQYRVWASAGQANCCSCVSRVRGSPVNNPFACLMSID